MKSSSAFSCQFFLFNSSCIFYFVLTFSYVYCACTLNKTDDSLSNTTVRGDGCQSVVIQKNCCHEDERQPICCLPAAKWFFEIDKTLATAIAISVTMTSVVLTVAIIVCCFWSKCPLYTACRVRYTHDLPTFYTVEKGDDPNLSTMPADATESQRRLVLTKNTNETGPPDAVEEKPVAV